MDSEKVIARDNNYVLHTYNRNPIVIEKGHGLHAYGPEGQNYLDFTSGIGVNSLGYCDLEWAEAVSRQAHKLQHTSNLYYTAPCSKLAKALCRRTGMSKVFFANSGAEANEGAIKAARKYSFDHYGEGRSTVITLVNSFHGRTLATLTATGQDGFHQYFGPFNEGFVYAPAGDIDRLTKLVDAHTCAVMLELVQGEGGVVALDPLFVQEVRALCDEKDLCLIVDEVQTGVGRTGTFLACEQYNLRPDIVTLAKGLGGGLPIGAVLVSDKVAAGMGPGRAVPGRRAGARRPAAGRAGKTAPRHRCVGPGSDAGGPVRGRHPGLGRAGRLPGAGAAGPDRQDPAAAAAAPGGHRPRHRAGAGDPGRSAVRDGPAPPVTPGGQP